MEWVSERPCPALPAAARQKGHPSPARPSCARAAAPADAARVGHPTHAPSPRPTLTAPTGAQHHGPAPLAQHSAESPALSSPQSSPYPSPPGAQHHGPAPLPEQRVRGRGAVGPAHHQPAVPEDLGGRAAGARVAGRGRAGAAGHVLLGSLGCRATGAHLHGLYMCWYRRRCRTHRGRRRRRRLAPLTSAVWPVALQPPQSRRRSEVLDEVLRITPPLLHQWFLGAPRRARRVSAACRLLRRLGSRPAARHGWGVTRLPARAPMHPTTRPPTAQHHPLHPPTQTPPPGKFTEPAAWLTARRAYTRTAAVWSMVGHVVGLGDRHGENILVRGGGGGGYVAAGHSSARVWADGSSSGGAQPPPPAGHAGRPPLPATLPARLPLFPRRPTAALRQAQRRATLVCPPDTAAPTPSAASAAGLRQRRRGARRLLLPLRQGPHPGQARDGALPVRCGGRVDRGMDRLGEGRPREGESLLAPPEAVPFRCAGADVLTGGWIGLGRAVQGRGRACWPRPRRCPSGALGRTC